MIKRAKEILAILVLITMISQILPVAALAEVAGAVTSSNENSTREVESSKDSDREQSSSDSDSESSKEESSSENSQEDSRQETDSRENDSSDGESVTDSSDSELDSDKGEEDTPDAISGSEEKEEDLDTSKDMDSSEKEISEEISPKDAEEPALSEETENILEDASDDKNLDGSLEEVSEEEESILNDFTADFTDEQKEALEKIKRGPPLSLHSVFENIQALRGPKEVQAINYLQFFKIENNDLVSKNDYRNGDKMHIKGDFTLPSNDINPGDYFVLGLPHQIRAEIGNLTLAASDGVPYANTHVDGNGNLVFTFNENVLGKENFSGTFEFAARMNGLNEDNTSENLDFSYNGQRHPLVIDITEINQGGEQSFGEKLFKWSGDLEDDGKIGWNLRANYDGKVNERKMLIDSLDEGHKFDPESFSIYKYQPRTSNLAESYNKATFSADKTEVWLSPSYPGAETIYIKFSDDFTKAEIHLDFQYYGYNLGYYFQVNYKTVITDKSKKEFINTAEFDGAESTNSYKDWSKGTITAQEAEELAKNKGSLKIIKKDAQLTDLFLEGAEFELRNNYKEEQIFTLTTDADGLAEINDLEGGSYSLLETKSPEGYLIDSEEIELVIDFSKEEVFEWVFPNKSIERMDIKVEKIWENDMGLINARPDIKINLYRNYKHQGIDEDRELVDSVVFTENYLQNAKSPKIHTWEDLYKTDFRGLAYRYAVEEEIVPNGYESTSLEEEFSEDGKEIKKVTITNRHTTDVGILRIYKKDAQADKFLEGAVFELTDPEDETFFLRETTDANGVIDFNGLEAGKTYILREVEAPDNYSLDAEYAEGVEIVCDFEKSNEKVKEITVLNSKVDFGKLRIVKKDAESKEVLAGAKFKLRDPSNPDFILEKETNEDGILEFDNLEAGKEYLLQEIAAPKGYLISEEYNGEQVLSFDFSEEKVFELEVLNQKEVVELTINKVWVDQGFEDKREKVTFEILRNGNPTGIEVDLEVGETEVTAYNLPKYAADSSLNVYSVKEIKYPEGYIPSYSEDGLTVTNTYKPGNEPITPGEKDKETVDITVTKIWANDKGLENKRPDVHIMLYKNDEPTMVVKHLSQGKETVTFQDLDKYDENGVEFVYTARETNVPEHYEASYSEDRLTITNTYQKEPGKPTTPDPKPEEVVELTINKVWLDQGFEDKREKVTFEILRNGNPTGIEVDLEVGETEVTVYNLPKYADDSSLNSYRVKEIKYPEGYTPSYSEDGLTVTNTYKPGNEPITPGEKDKETVDITVTKIWANDKGLENKRPDVHIMLYKNDEPTMVVKHLSQGKETVTFQDLDKYDENGVEFVYTARETNVPEHYEASYSEDRLTITNTYQKEPGKPIKPGKPDREPSSNKLTLTAEKIWLNDTVATREDIKIQLYRNGEAFDKAKILAKGESQVSWTDLNKLDSEGREYVYTVDELDLPKGYEKKVEGFTITNTYISEDEPKKAGSKKPKDPEKPEEDKDPKEPTEPKEENTNKPEEPKEEVVVTEEDEEENEATGEFFENTEEYELKELPKTGEVAPRFFYALGLSLIAIGLFLRKRLV